MLFLRILAIRLLYPCDQCLDAASGQPPRLGMGMAACSSTSLSGLLTNPWLLCAVRAQHDGCRGYGIVRHGVGRLVLSPVRSASGPCQDILTDRRGGRCDRLLFWELFPTGDGNARQVFEKHQPIKGAAFEGLFKTERGAGLYLVGQPNLETMTIDNPIEIPTALSFLVYSELYAQVKGLDAFPRKDWPDNLALLYDSYHIMAGLGTILVSIMGLALLWLWRGRLFTANWLLWLLMLCAPFPYIATTAGWMTAELGRQPWLVYGLLRTSEGASPLVHSGNALFTLLGFLGLYLLLGILFLFLIAETIRHGPTSHSAGHSR